MKKGKAGSFSLKGGIIGWVLVTLLVVGFLSFTRTPCVAQEKFKVGTSQDLSGIYAGVYGKVVEGAELGFKEINATGGIKGREIEFVCYDDGYEVSRSLRNVDKLVLQDKVDLLFATAGTPPNASIKPRLSILKKPLFFPGSGAIFLYSGDQRYLFTFLPAYRDESRTIIRLMGKDGYKRIGIVHLTNVYGWDCKIAAKKEALALGLQVSTFPLEKEEGIPSAVEGLMAKKVEALYLVIPYKFVGPFLEVMDARGYHPALYAEYYCRLPDAFQALGARGDVFKKVVVGRFFPMLNENYPCVTWYKEALQKYAPDKSPDPAAFTGYLMARTLGEILRRVHSMDSWGIVKGAESIKDLDVGLPEKISYSPTDHVGLTKVFLYRYANGALTLVEK